jgi:hypothetical protein
MGRGTIDIPELTIQDADPIDGIWLPDQLIHQLSDIPWLPIPERVFRCQADAVGEEKQLLLRLVDEMLPFPLGAPIPKARHDPGNGDQ